MFSGHWPQVRSCLLKYSTSSLTTSARPNMSSPLSSRTRKEGSDVKDKLGTQRDAYLAAPHAGLHLHGGPRRGVPDVHRCMRPHPSGNSVATVLSPSLRAIVRLRSSSEDSQEHLSVSLHQPAKYRSET